LFFIPPQTARWVPKSLSIQVLLITVLLLVKLIQRHLQLLGISIKRYLPQKYIILKLVLWH